MSPTREMGGHAVRVASIILVFTCIPIQSNAQVITQDIQLEPDTSDACICVAPDGRRYRDLYGGDCPDPDSGRAIYDCDSEPEEGSDTTEAETTESSGTIELADPDALKPVEDPDKAYAMSLDYFHGRNGTERDDRKAFRLARGAAKAGNAGAQNLLGVMYALGRGVERDVELGFEWKLKAAKAGDLHAQQNVGWHLENGEGTRKDLKQALAWYRRAAKDGHPSAMRSIGLLYQKGLGVSQSYEKALEWLRRAAAAGNPDAMNDIGLFHQRGWGVSKDFEEAADWYRRSAEAGYRIAMKNLANLYEAGAGVPKDLDQAQYWRERAERKEEK